MTSALPEKVQSSKPPGKARPRKTAIEQPPAHWRMSGKHPPAVWRMADCDEQQWRDMGCPTMGVALTRIVTLEAQVVELHTQVKALEAQVHDREAELLATPVPAPNSRMLARKAKRARA